jgi:hypothetical protein
MIDSSFSWKATSTGTEYHDMPESQMIQKEVRICLTAEEHEWNLVLCSWLCMSNISALNNIMCFP